mgnify:CR=1 FL=1
MSPAESIHPISGLRTWPPARVLPVRRPTHSVPQHASARTALRFRIKRAQRRSLDPEAAERRETKPVLSASPSRKSLRLKMYGCPQRAQSARRTPTRSRPSGATCQHGCRCACSPALSASARMRRARAASGRPPQCCAEPEARGLAGLHDVSRAATGSCLHLNRRQRRAPSPRIHCCASLPASSYGPPTPFASSSLAANRCVAGLHTSPLSARLSHLGKSR